MCAIDDNDDEGVICQICCGDSKRSCIGGILGLGALLTCILLPISFHYVEHDQYALRKNTHTNTVQTDAVYDTGRYCWGPQWEVMTFPSTWQTIEFTGERTCRAGNTEGVTMLMDVILSYRIIKENLGNLYTTYGINYHQVLESQVMATIKNTAIVMSVDTFLENRTHAAVELSTAIGDMVAEKFSGLEAPARMFKLSQITFADALHQSRLDAAIQLETNEQKLYEQEEVLARANTTNMVAEYHANATVLLQAAEATKEANRETALAQQEEALIQERATGLNNLLTDLGISDATLKEKFLKLMALLDNESAKIIDVESSVIVDAGRRL